MDKPQKYRVSMPARQMRRRARVIQTHGRVGRGNRRLRGNVRFFLIIIANRSSCGETEALGAIKIKGKVVTMRKLTALALMLMLLLGLAAGAAAEKTYTFGYIYASAEDDWNAFDYDCFADAAKRMGVNVVSGDAGWTPDTQLNIIQDMHIQGVDGIYSYTMSPEGDVKAAELCKELGIPIVFVNSEPAPTIDPASYVTTVCCSYYDYGYTVVNYVAKNYPGSKIFYCAGNLGMGIIEEYMRGIEAALKDNNNSVEIVKMTETNWMADSGLAATQDMIASGVAFDTVFANSEQIAMGVVAALEGAGLMEKTRLVSTGGSAVGIQLMNEGKLEMVAGYGPGYQAYMGFKALYAAAVHGDWTEQKLYTYSPEVLTKENATSMEWTWIPNDKMVEHVGGLDGFK